MVGWSEEEGSGSLKDSNLISAGECVLEWTSKFVLTASVESDRVARAAARADCIATALIRDT